MSLATGAKLGPYEIVAPLGAGGMGEVYRARDTRLGREVAIKVLPESVAADAERLRRFAQEARAVAALNHPNILSVHDIGQQADTHYMVTELLEGETLREKVREEALPQRKAIEYALQIAAGLGAAHEKGIVHRDLKPENLFVTRDGRVKILDFGLAKAQSVVAAFGATADGATLEAAPAKSHTADGVVLGTVGYMSPEQVKGKTADSRSDIFAFGAVLYELLSGRRAFQRDSSVETMTAILKEDVAEIGTETIHVSPGLDRIVRRCLEKEPEQRFQSAKDLGFALEAVSGSSHSIMAMPAAKGRRGQWLAIAVVLVAVLALAAYFAGTRMRGEPATFERLTFQRGYIKGARFTPDGQNVIYSAMWEGRPYEVFSTRIGDHTARSLELKKAMVVGVSAAGDIAVLTNVRRIRTTNWMQMGTLARAPASGGSAREILENVWDADISRDGKQFAVVRTTGGPHQLEYPIGKVLFTTNGYISHPRIAPDGKSVAFMEHPLFGDDRGYVSLVDANGTVKRLTGDAGGEEGLAWSADGREIWYAATEPGTLSQERMIWAVTLAGKMRKIFQVPDDTVVSDIFADGRLLFSHESLSSAQMVASPANGPERNVAALGYATYGALSSDGKMVAFTESGPGSTDDYLIFFRRLDGSAAVELGEGSSMGLTPDGKYVVAQVPSHPTRLRILPTGAGETRTFDIAPVNVDRHFISWIPGAREFVFLGHEGLDPPHAYRVAMAGGPARSLTSQKGAHFWNRISPDGKFVLEAAGVANNWGVPPVMVDLASGAVHPAALLEGDGPVDWDQDGRHVFVVRESESEATILRVDVFTGHREVWKQIRPADPAGVLSMTRFYVTPSGNAYAYSASRVLSALYVYSKK